MSQWQPIETVPLDGTEVMVAGQHGSDWWMAVMNARYSLPIIQERLRHARLPEASHWMSLPPPPDIADVTGKESP